MNPLSVLSWTHWVWCPEIHWVWWSWIHWVWGPEPTECDVAGPLPGDPATAGGYSMMMMMMFGWIIVADCLVPASSCDHVEPAVSMRNHIPTLPGVPASNTLAFISVTVYWAIYRYSQPLVRNSKSWIYSGGQISRWLLNPDHHKKLIFENLPTLGLYTPCPPKNNTNLNDYTSYIGLVQFFCNIFTAMYPRSVKICLPNFK